MRQALSQARRASGRTFPNPPVGAVVFRGDRILGRGYTRPAGGPHAEVVALGRATQRFGAGKVRGASLAVTLEPCSHVGRTGPCTQQVIDAGVRRVIVGHADPHERVRGRGLRRLRGAGIDVCVGVLEAECREQHRGFLSVCERARPFVTLKLAASLDGRIATARGESRWITGPASRAAVHRLRNRTDALMVGSETALADDPELTVRRDGRVLHRPLRVLVDSRLRVPENARLFRGDPERTWVLCAGAAPERRRRAREKLGARLIRVPARGGHLDLRAALEKLATAGLTDLLVEGGGGLAAALLRRGLVDELHWFTSPLLLGADGRAGLGALQVPSLATAFCVADMRCLRRGEDLHLWGRVERRERGRGGRT